MRRSHKVVLNGGLRNLRVTGHSSDLREDVNPFMYDLYRPRQPSVSWSRLNLKHNSVLVSLNRLYQNWPPTPSLFLKWTANYDSRWLWRAQRDDTEGQLSFSSNGRLYRFPRTGRDFCSARCVFIILVDVQLGGRKPKTALVTHSRLYQIICVSFGITNASASFQRALIFVIRNRSGSRSSCTTPI